MECEVYRIIDIPNPTTVSSPPQNDHSSMTLLSTSTLQTIFIDITKKSMYATLSSAQTLSALTLHSIHQSSALGVRITQESQRDLTWLHRNGVRLRRGIGSWREFRLLLAKMNEKLLGKVAVEELEMSDLIMSCSPESNLHQTSSSS